MRFALLGNDPDGLEMTSALVESGRHELAAYSAPVAEEYLRRWNPGVRRVADGEEILADPSVDMVLVAGGPGVRPLQLRRALQSERHVLCVHPADGAPEAAYEAAMLQKDSGCVLLPLLPAALHPAVRRLASFVERDKKGSGSFSPAGVFVLLEMEIASGGEVLRGLETGQKVSFPGWDLLRALGGEVQEITAFAEGEELLPGAPVLVAGRFQRGGLFRVALLPHRPEAHLRLAVLGSSGSVELLFPQGWAGPAILSWQDAGESQEEYWDRWDPWMALVEAFEGAVAPPPPVSPEQREAIGPTWQDAVRCLELDDAARRSVERRRASPLEYPEASEEVGFKGTMTLVGCAMVWAILLLLILSAWVPAAGWLIVPLLVVFLSMQLLRYLIPGPPPQDKRKT